MDIVVHGDTNVMMDEDGTDPYAIPKERGIFKAISSGSLITTADIVERIINHRFVICYTRRHLSYGLPVTPVTVLERKYSDCRFLYIFIYIY